MSKIARPARKDTIAEELGEKNIAQLLNLVKDVLTSPAGVIIVIDPIEGREVKLIVGGCGACLKRHLNRLVDEAVEEGLPENCGRK